MENYFNVNLEFNKDKIDEAIQRAIEKGMPAYVCSVDGNSLVSANKNPTHLEALNGALINLCDSAWTPVFVNLIHGTKYKNYTGADLFLEYIKQKRYRQFFLGSTEEILSGLKTELSKIDSAIAEMQFRTLPFKKVDEFDYPQIAQMINEDNPDIVWVSLGAPKQEQFMARLKPFLNRGVLFGFGAIFNFNSGYSNQRRAPLWMIRLKMEWLFRTFQEPPRMGKRYWNVIISFPGLIVQEIKNK
ncbi:glycosyl transferase [Bacteroidia bacterium]|nr:glycosyl transferase [Bacteroidia bacterium]